MTGLIPLLLEEDRVQVPGGSTRSWETDCVANSRLLTEPRSSRLGWASLRWRFGNLNQP